MSVKISELSELLVPLDSDVVAIVNSGETKKITYSNLVSLLSAEIIRLTKKWTSTSVVPLVGAVLPAYENINTLVTSSVVQHGRYKVDMSHIYTYDTTNKSAYMRARITYDNVVGAWFTLRREQKDATDQTPVSYFDLFDVTTDDNTVTVEVQMSRESGSDDLSVLSSSLLLSRVS